MLEEVPRPPGDGRTATASLSRSVTSGDGPLGSEAALPDDRVGQVGDARSVDDAHVPVPSCCLDPIDQASAAPSTTGTREIVSSSRRPALRHRCTIVAPRRFTSFASAAPRACETASSMPPVMNVHGGAPAGPFQGPDGSSRRGDPRAASRASHAPGMSYVRRPVISAPTRPAWLSKNSPPTVWSKYLQRAIAEREF